MPSARQASAQAVQACSRLARRTGFLEPARCAGVVMEQAANAAGSDAMPSWTTLFKHAGAAYAAIVLSIVGIDVRMDDAAFKADARHKSVSETPGKVADTPAPTDK